MRFQLATLEHARLLAEMNEQLILDEGHRNVMALPELEARMEKWLGDGYCAVVFFDGDEPLGYALFRHDPEHVYLRQFYVAASKRRKGFGREAFHWLLHNEWQGSTRIRIDVLVNNGPAITFWQELGFLDYCITMEREA